MYVKMPFGLMNAGTTFQRAMDISFVDELARFIVIYLDDVIVYSKFDEEHLLHLRRVFEKCRKFGISLNLMKILFGLEEGKLLGHIISKGWNQNRPQQNRGHTKIRTPKKPQRTTVFYRENKISTKIHSQSGKAPQKHYKYVKR